MSERTRRPGQQSLWPLLLLLLVPLVVGAALVMLGAGLGSINLSFGPTPSTLPPPPPPSEYGTRHEIGTRGDTANPRALFHGAYPSDGDTQERRVGGLPARFSGYTTWVRSITRVPAPPLVGVYPGQFLRVRVTVFNRDVQTQHVCSCDFFVWTSAAGLREADALRTRTLSPDASMSSGGRRDGLVYLYVGTVAGPYFVLYNPDAHVPGHASAARAVWRAPA
jgi:hypothetical protein